MCQEMTKDDDRRSHALNVINKVFGNLKKDFFYYDHYYGERKLIEKEFCSKDLSTVAAAHYAVVLFRVTHRHCGGRPYSIGYTGCIGAGMHWSCADHTQRAYIYRSRDVGKKCPVRSACLGFHGDITDTKYLELAREDLEREFGSKIAGLDKIEVPPCGEYCTMEG